VVFKGDLDGTQKFVQIESFRPDIDVVLRQARFVSCKQPVGHWAGVVKLSRATTRCCGSWTAYRYYRLWFGAST
jgi:hypothetical protein